jgi:hypothetical protein
MTEKNETSVCKTMIIHRPDRLDDVVGQETLVVCGSERGMTSLVAFCLYNTGYFIGEFLGPDNHEDLEFMAAIPHPSQQVRPLAKGRLPTLIEKRNLAHERWGFKLPRAAFHVRELDPLLRNPVFVVCVRNPVSVAKSILAREAKGFELLHLMSIARRPFDAIEAVITETAAPLLIVDMDQVSRSPGVFVNEIAAALRLEGDFSEIGRAISQSGYKRSAARDGSRFVTGPEFRKAMGQPG